MEKHLVIRADADSRMGIGHIMRCMALAQGCRDHGWTVVFLGHCTIDRLKTCIRDEGFDFVPLQTVHPHPEDLLQTLRFLNSMVNAWLVVDGYHFTVDYLDAVTAGGHRLMLVDDDNEFDHYSADVILNSNFEAEKMMYPAEPHTELLLGIQYTLIRHDFLKGDSGNRTYPPTASKILITLGGADPDNTTLGIMHTLRYLQAGRIRAKIVIGPANPHAETLSKETEKEDDHFGDHQIDFQIETNAEMPALMAWADLVISGVGGTVWELLYMGAPMITVGLADNHEPVGRALEAAGVSRHLGPGGCLEPETAAEIVSSVIKDRRLRKQMAVKGRVLVDGKGPQRIRSCLEQFRDHNNSLNTDGGALQ